MIKVEACTHRKVWGESILTSCPSKRHWICQYCLARGIDVEIGPETNKDMYDGMIEVYAIAKELYGEDQVQTWLHTQVEGWNYLTPYELLLEDNYEGVLNLIRREEAGEAGY